MVLGVPASELLLLAALIIVAGFVTGILAGLFGIGGGALIVPVLYEVFRVLDVPNEVRFQLCVGTSIAIIVPTNVVSYLTHRGKGAVMMDVVRAWAVPAVVGVVAGSAIAAFAPPGVLKLAFVVIASIIAFKLLIGRDSWRLADDLPGRAGMTAYGVCIGLATAVTDAAALARLRIADRFCADGARREFHRALWRAVGPRALEAPTRGCFRLLLAGCVRSLCGEPDRLRVAAHQELVAADLPALQPVEKGHAEQTCAQLPGLRNERGD